MSATRTRVALTVAALALLALAWMLYPRKRELPQPPPAVAGERPPVSAAYQTVSHTVKPGQTAGEVLRILDAGAADTLLAAADGRLDRVSVGDTFHLDRKPGPKGPAIWRLRLVHGDEEVLHLERGASGWSAEKLPIPYTVQEGVQTVVVEDGSSLWGAAQKYGLEEGQIGALAVIYEYDVDFNTEIQPGAVIRAVTERLIADDGSSRFGDIRAAEFVNGGKTYTAIRFTDKDGRVGWFAPDGKGRRKKFLRSPLAFSRVTSGFTMARWHPVLKTARPHFGTDFGCPVGTPVRAVSDGVVTAAGSHGGHGNYVELKHEGPYTTSYSHLSRILVKRGQRVQQGDTIAHSGNTGLSTGPHLHYQFMKNGSFVNPMTVELPMSGGPDTIDMEAFGKVRDAVMPMLEAARAVPPAPASALPDASAHPGPEQPAGAAAP